VKRLITLIAAVVFFVSTFAIARPAQAMTCAPDLEDACRIVATVVCGVVAKGKPCLA